MLLFSIYGILLLIFKYQMNLFNIYFKVKVFYLKNYFFRFIFKYKNTLIVTYY